MALRAAETAVENPHEILRKGDWFGELSLVGCKSWGAAYGARAEFVAQVRCYACSTGCFELGKAELGWFVVCCTEGGYAAIVYALVCVVCAVLY